MKHLVPLIAISLALAACSTAVPAAACDQAEFIEHVILDVPVQDGTEVMPGTHFTKTWLVTNRGTCDWGDGYALVHSGGETFGAVQEQALPDVPAGEIVEISLRMTAPDRSGEYAGEWLLRNPAGERFGVGADGNQPLEATLSVPELPAGVVYDFIHVACLTRWDSGRATFLPCEGEDDDLGLLQGYVRINSDPSLEASTSDNPPVLEVKPNNQSGNFIAGFFPPITLQEGDHFAATVGCMDENPGCRLLFYVEAQWPDGTRRRLLEWAEEADDMRHEIEADLSELAGEEISLVLIVSENGGRSLEGRGFWMDPRIERRLP
ncbi:MAG: hypothetical protein KIS80_09570 [Anaerolineales bacterium]|nr:hypothetical protein [Anaerolineales bacterium]